ncbi:hypothetical protein AC579_4069 [Pseudocercospora musae]|uniref:Cell wall protein n=1 Tax=Pseudocercospora musae TaxID=113226 RepID=A0A139I987_9PEZI|nr:hypothetical protein AC579_4069 [Pseudocercospora musae]
MRFATLIVSSLLTIASAIALATVEKRDAASIISAVKNIQSKITTLNSTVTSFNKGDLDGLVKVLKIQQQSTDVGNAVKSATSTAQASQPIPADTATSTPNNQVAAAVLSLKDSLQSFLTNLQSKKPAFDSVVAVVSVSQQIKQTLTQQKGSSDALGTAITIKLASPYKDFAPLITGQIDGYFNQAIQTFSQPGGVISLPPLPIKEKL